jgi:hypothetical protein
VKLAHQALKALGIEFRREPRVVSSDRDHLGH